MRVLKSERDHRYSTFERAIGRGLGLRSSAAIAVVSLAAGLLLGLVGSSARDQAGRIDLDLPTLVRERQGAVLELEASVDDLSQQVEELYDLSVPTAIAQAPKPLSRIAVEGPGVTVMLSDAPADFVADGPVSVNDMVVHQQDIDAVMNALWRGGAESMSVQGVRITASTEVRCVGNVILIGSRAYSPPYRIDAIGDPELLAQSLNEDPLVALYRDAANRYQMGWSVQKVDLLSMPASTETVNAKFAQVAENT